MKARELTHQDYEVLCEWWRFWRFTPPAIELLPDYGLGGIMIEDEDGTPLSCGFIYDTNSHICWIEYIVANPKIDKQLRSKSIDVLLENLKYLCKERKYIIAFSSIKNESLLNKYLDNGWALGTKNTNEMVLQLWGQQQE
jgi:hypothetical protein